VAGPIEELRQQAERAATFGQRVEAKSQLYRLGCGPDPWEPTGLMAELQEVAARGTATALADAGQAMLAAGRFGEVARWLPRLTARSDDDREALSIVQALLAIRDGDNADALELVATIPQPEAVALCGLALMQLGDIAQAAARLEVLLAANALNAEGELEPTYLPDATPVVSLFLTACLDTARAHLRAGRRAEARRHAEAGQNAVQRYPDAELDEDVAAELGELLDATAE
jgi:hypothetical protein